MEPLVIFGTGGFAREVHELIEDINDRQRRFDVLGFLDGNPSVHGTRVHDLPVLGAADWVADHPDLILPRGRDNDV